MFHMWVSEMVCFSKECFPDAKRIGLLEWFYNSSNSDVDFLNRVVLLPMDHSARLRVWNSELLIELSTLDKAVVPTHWQKSQFPIIFRDNFKLFMKALIMKLASLEIVSFKYSFLDFLPDEPDIQVITYVSRCFETYRGFPQLSVFSKNYCIFVLMFMFCLLVKMDLHIVPLQLTVSFGRNGQRKILIWILLVLIGSVLYSKMNT